MWVGYHIAWDLYWQLGPGMLSALKSFTTKNYPIQNAMTTQLTKLHLTHVFYNQGH